MRGQNRGEKSVPIELNEFPRWPRASAQLAGRAQSREERRCREKKGEEEQLEKKRTRRKSHRTGPTEGFKYAQKDEGGRQTTRLW